MNRKRKIKDKPCTLPPLTPEIDIYIFIYIAKCALSCKSFRKFRESSGTQNYSGTKFGLIRVLWIFLLQFVPDQKFTLNRKKWVLGGAQRVGKGVIGYLRLGQVKLDL